MKCTYCGAPLEEGRIFCLKCGEEIVWVPDYNAISSYRSQSEEAVKEAARRAVENDRRQQVVVIEAEEITKNKKKRKTPWIIAIIFILLLGVGGFFGIRDYIAQTSNNVLAYQQKELHIANTPVISPSGGEYDELLRIEIYLDEGAADKIYYTTDGSEPNEKSQIYIEKIELKEGTTTIKAVTISDENVSSDIVEETYTINLLPPETPKIAPSTGEFTKAMDTKIHINVPDGCTAYYAFDEEPTMASNVYTNPIDMPEGQHILYAFLVDQHGKRSEIGNALYNLISDTEETVE